MHIFTNYKPEWAIGITCAFLPGVIGLLISKTADIPDIKIPFWLFCIFLCAPLAYYLYLKSTKKARTITNKEYGVERVIVDGKNLVACTFDNTELVFRGKAITSMSHCKGNIARIAFEDNAILTAHYIGALYSDPATKIYAEAFINQIIQIGKQKHNENSKQ